MTPILLRSPRRTPFYACLLAFCALLPLSSVLAAQDRKVSLPLEPSDTLRFALEEASWISLDVTPDGQQVVFEVLGDLYRMPAAGGAATPLTRGLPFDVQPVVSPDGQWVAFISDRDGSEDLWIGRLGDGLLTDLKKLSSERQNRVVSPAWTPDSRYVIVTRFGRETELRMYHLSGGSGVSLGAPSETSGGGDDPAGMGADMSPDGRWLYFARSGGGGGTFPSWQIARRDMVTGQVDDVTQAEWSAVRPVVSPDGRRLVYATRHEAETGLRIRDLETGADRWLIWPIQRDAMEGGGRSRDNLPGYTFTPDGSEVVTTRGGKIVAVDVASGSVRTIPFRVDVEQPIGPALEFTYPVEQGPVRARLIQSPTVSPDGRRAAFSALTHVYVMDLAPAGSEAASPTPRRVTPEDSWAFKPAWSPDGRWLAYVTWSVDGGHIWKIRSDGRGRPERLTTHPAFYTDLAWAPDGERIVALRGNAWQRTQTFSEFGGLRIPLDVVWLPADGGDVRLVVPARGVGTPHFAGDPDRIYVYSRDGLISMRFDGTDRRVHLEVTGRPNPRSPRPPSAETVLMRPDGRWALASSANQLYLVAVPPVGGAAPSVSVSGGGVPVKRVTDIGADYFGWADDGETLFWSIGSTLFRRPFDSIAFEDEDADEAEDAGDAGEGAEGDGAPLGTELEEEEDEDADEEFEPADYAEDVTRTDVVLTFPRALPEGTVALRGARVITMDGEGTVIENADVVVRNNRIEAVGPRGTVEIPRGTREMDATGKTIVPGFIDTHAHWEFRTHDVLEPHNWSLLANLAYGVTAGLDVQTSTNDYFAYQDLVDAGRSIGQRAFMTGPGVFSSNDFRSYEETEAYLRRYKEHYHTPNIKSYLVGNREQRQWVVQASEKLGLMPTTEGGGDLALDLTHAIDGFHGNEHNIPIVPLYRDVVELYARTKTAYTPTLLVLYGGPSAREYFFQREDVHADEKLARFTPHNRLDEMVRRRRLWVMEDEQKFDEVAAVAAEIQRAGGLVGVGGHGELQGLGYHWEMWALSMGGMTPTEVLEAATIDGARIIGVDGDLGSIEAGKLADLVVLDRNPLDDIRNTNTVRWVMKGGELYEGDTLDQLWPVERPLPELWWWQEGPAAAPN